MTAGPIAFTLNGAPRALPPGTSPTLTLLDWLRGPAGLTGTKEGCAEGDCGACTVVIEEADGTKSFWAMAHPANAPDFHDPACFVLELPAAMAA